MRLFRKSDADIEPAYTLPSYVQDQIDSANRWAPLLYSHGCIDQANDLLYQAFRAKSDWIVGRGMSPLPFLIE